MFRRFRWWLVACLAIALILGGLAFASWLTLRAYGPTLARERLEEELTRVLDHPVRIERVVLRPWLGRLELFNVRLEAGSEPNGEPIVHLGHVQLQIGISSLWKRELVLSRILLQEVTLRLTVLGEAGPLPTLDVPDRIQIGPIGVWIRTVQIQRGRITYRDPQKGLHLDIQGLEVTARPVRSGVDASLRFSTLQLQVPGVRETFADVAVAGWIHQDLLSLRELTGRWHAREVRVTGEVRQPLAAPELLLNVEGELDLAHLPKSADIPWVVAGIAKGEATLHGRLQALRVSGRIAVPELTAGPIRARELTVQGQWSQGVLDLSRVSARIFEGDLHGTLVTRLDRLADTRATFRLQRSSLAALETLTPTPPGVRGELDLDAHVEGDLRRLEETRGRIRLAGRRIEFPGELSRLGAGTLSAEGTFDKAVLDLTRATGGWTGIQIEAAGRLGEQGPMGLRAVIDAEMGSVAPLWGMHGISGQASLRGEATGRWNDPQIAGQLRMPSLSVTGTGIDAIEMPFRFREKTLQVDSAAGRLGQSRVAVSGMLAWSGGADFSRAHIGRSLQFRAEVHAPAGRWEDVAPWLPPTWQGSGRFSLDGRIEGSPAAWRASGSLEAQSLAARGGLLIQDLHSTFNLDQDRLDIAHLRAQLSGIPLHGSGGWTWDGSGRGSVEAGPMDLSRLPDLPSQVALRGTGRARVEISTRPGALEGTGLARLSDVSIKGVPLRDGSLRASLVEGRLRGDLDFPDAKLTATATGQLEGDRPLSLRLVAREVALGPILRSISQANGTQLDGVVTAVAEFSVPLSAPSALQGTVTLDPVRLLVAGEDWSNREPVMLRWGQTGLVVERLNVAGRLGNLTAGGRLDPRGALDFDVRGQFPLAILPALRPEIRAAGGLLTLSARVGGTAAAPSIRADAAVREGLLQFRDYPETLRQIEARCIVSPDGLRLVEAEASLGRGKIRASGDLAFEGGKPGAYRALIKAQSIALAPVEGLQTVWDMDLEVVGKADQPWIRGEARLVRGIYSGDLSLLSLLLRESPGQAASAGPAIPLRILLHLDNNLQVQTNLARLRLGGTLSLEGTTADPILFGRVESREGRISFRQHRWTVTSAAAQFTDPQRLDPIIDVTATTRIRTYDVTMRVSGRSEELMVHLSSKPPLPEQEVLALATLGTTSPPTGESGAGLVLAEMVRLLVDDILGIGTSSLGLDTVNLGTVEEAGQTKMRVGTQVSEKVQVIYSQTLRGSTQRLLRVEYQLLGPLLIAGEQDFQGGYGGDVFVRLRFR